MYYIPRQIYKLDAMTAILKNRCRSAYNIILFGSAHIYPRAPRARAWSMWYTVVYTCHVSAYLVPRLTERDRHSIDRKCTLWLISRLTLEQCSESRPGTTIPPESCTIRPSEITLTPSAGNYCPTNRLALQSLNNSIGTSVSLLYSYCVSMQVPSASPCPERCITVGYESFSPGTGTAFPHMCLPYGFTVCGPSRRRGCHCQRYVAMYR